MLYLFIENNQIKLLYLKKTMLGQYESAFYEKTHQLELTKDGEISNMDFFASAIREAITMVNPAASKDREVQLVLPQEAFAYMRAEIPPDIAPSAISSFIRDKARAQISMDLEDALSDYIIQENDNVKQILFYAISKETLRKYNEAFNLLNLLIINVIPEPLTYFKLFEKTLRKDKKEYIMYVSYEKEEMKGYFYDTFGPLEEKKVTHAIAKTTTLEKILKEKAEEHETKGKKLNRVILSGQESENVRQDTFTKDVGVWTNPLKRIIPQFYQDYLKILVTTQDKSLPVLLYDVCIGAFIFSLENKQFSLFRKGNLKGNLKKTSGSSRDNDGPRNPRKFPLKEILLFVGSFVLSFAVLLFVMKIPVGNFLPTGISFKPNPTATPTPAAPTATPTPAISRKDIKVKILNGTGTAGKASEIKDLLKAKGYEDILTGNADNFDYTATEIQVSKSKPGLAELIKGDLKDNVANPKITELTSDSTADVVIIFGPDFK